MCFSGIAFGEKRANGTINEAGLKGFAIARSAFSFDKAAGNTAGRIEFFSVVNGKWKKINAFKRF